MQFINDFVNKIICGNCFDILPTMPSDSVDLIIIDPPYLITKELWDKKEVVNEILSKELYRILKDTGSLYVWCGIGEKSQSLIRWFPIFSKSLIFKDLITWKKQRGIGMRKGWLYTREECMWFVKDNKKFIWNLEYQCSDIDKYAKIPKGFKMKDGGYSGKYLRNKEGYKRLTNVWSDIVEESFDTIHKSKNKIGHFTPKPLKAIERIIKVHTKENDIVLDCFLGSGTTAIAAQRLKRIYIGIELNAEYVEIANRCIIAQGAQIKEF